MRKLKTYYSVIDTRSKQGVHSPKPSKRDVIATAISRGLFTSWKQAKAEGWVMLGHDTRNGWMFDNSYQVDPPANNA